MSDDTFNLRQMVVQTIGRHGVVNTPEARHAVARDLARRIPADKRALALIVALTYMIEKVVTHQRPYLRPLPALDTRPELSPVPEGQPGSVSPPTDSVMQRTTRKVGRYLRATYSSVPDKEFGDYTREDLETVAAYLEKSAADSLRKASRYRDLGAHMSALGLKCVRDLPWDLLARVFDEQAA